MDVEKVLGNLSLNAKKRLAVITESKPFLWMELYAPIDIILKDLFPT